MMNKRSVYTSVTPLPASCSRALAVSFLHDHFAIIDLSPTCIHREKAARPPAKCSAEEFHAAWYTITDRMSYFPGIKGKLTYNVCFHDLANGVQTHVYAPTGVDIKDKWTVCGNEPGEPRQPVEIGLNAPKDGLYLREDVDIKSNVMFTKIVKEKNIQGHKVMVDRLIEKAKLADRDAYNQNLARQQTFISQDPYASQVSSPMPPGSPYRPTSPYQQSHSPYQQGFPIHDQSQQQDSHESQYMYRNEKSPAAQSFSTSAWAQPAPAYHPYNDVKLQAPPPGQHPAHARHDSQYQAGQSSAPSARHSRQLSNQSKHQIAELPSNDQRDPIELA